jgi:hypothetical protein
MSYNALVPIVLFGFIPVSLLLFMVMSVPRAIAATYVLGWLFLPPNIGYNLPGIPDWTKYNALAVATILGAIIFDGGRFFAFRARWYDLPALLFCLVPLASSLSNGLGAWDGLSGVLTYFFQWGTPYFIARIYFSNLSGVRDLAIWIVIGAIIYVPLCLFEIRMSPQLNKWIYGYYQNPFNQTRRLGGFRPMVFMNTGLAVGLWMCAGTLIAFMCWLGGWPKKLFGLPMLAWVAVLGATAVLCKSLGAVMLLIAAMIVGYLSKVTRMPVFLLMLAIVPVGYIGLRATNIWDGSSMIELFEKINPERANSLMVRIRNETVTVERGLERPLLGWGGWGRNRVSIEDSGFRSIVDGLWVIIVSQRGLIGLAGMLFILLAPCLLFVTRWRKLGMWHPWLLPGLGMCLVLTMFTADSLFNAMLNPIYVLAAGAVMGMVADQRTMAAVLSTLRTNRGPAQTIAPRGASMPRATPGQSAQPGAPVVMQSSGAKI